MNPRPDPDGTGKLERAYLEHRRAHPEVYTELVRLTRRLARRGHRRLGVGMLWEVLRWQILDRTDAGELAEQGPLLNNNHRAFYAREIMATEPGLAGIFETRRQGVPAHVVPPDEQPPAIGSGRRPAPLPVREDADGALALDLGAETFAAPEPEGWT